jgi:hypothetical protein
VLLRVLAIIKRARDIKVRAMPYVILGVIVLGLLLYAARLAANADVAKVGHFLGWLVVGLGAAGGIALLVLLIASERWAPAFLLIGGFAAAIIRGRQWWQRRQADIFLRSNDLAGPEEAMTRAEAFAILGLEPGADTRQIKDAHRRLVTKVHPSRGGSPFLAVQINRAKALLLGE